MNIVDKLKGKNILIWGYGREGKSTEKFLNKYCDVASVKIYEGNRDGIEEEDFDLIIKSPGIVMNDENPKYTSQTELFLEQFRDKVIGITGTKGKSTTSAILYTVLKECSDKNVILLGNIGRPCLDYFAAKKNITKYQTKDDYLFLGVDIPQIETSATIIKVFKQCNKEFNLRILGDHNQYNAEFVYSITVNLLGLSEKKL